tara:strand:+ start:7766 stop:8437 length:672 start_codon:yes stop_codon:yes gene_type:complete
VLFLLKFYLHIHAPSLKLGKYALRKICLKENLLKQRRKMSRAPNLEETDVWSWLSPTQKFYIQLLDQFKKLNVTQKKISDASERLATSSENIAVLTQDIVRLMKQSIGAPKPGSLNLVVESEMAGKLQFKVVLPVWPVGTDIESGELTVDVAGVVLTVPVAMDQAEVTGLEGDQDAAVDLSFVYIDDAGNRSANPSVFSGTLVDNIAPQDAGTLGIEVTGEIP